MNCIKCGQESQGEDVFCQTCLLEMQKYPVEPGTVVLLPRRKETSVKKTVKRHTPSQEEQISFLRRRVALLTLLLAICIALILVMLKPAMHYIRDEHYEIGQNYSSVTDSEEDSSD